MRVPTDRTPPSDRNPVMVLLLLFVTCGLYYPYWLYKTSEEMDDFLGQSDLPPIIHLLLFILTVGFWSYVWDFMTAQRIVQMQQRVGIATKDDTLVYVVCDLLGAGPVAGLGIVVPLLQQTRLNEVYDAARSRAYSSQNRAYSARF